MARTFAKLMMEGKVKAALRILAQDSNGGGINCIIRTKRSTHSERITRPSTSCYPG